MIWKSNRKKKGHPFETAPFVKLTICVISWQYKTRLIDRIDCPICLLPVL